jgi:hypothetical protein
VCVVNGVRVKCPTRSIFFDLRQFLFGEVVEYVCEKICEIWCVSVRLLFVCVEVVPVMVWCSELRRLQFIEFDGAILR